MIQLMIVLTSIFPIGLRPSFPEKTANFCKKNLDHQIVCSPEVNNNKKKRQTAHNPSIVHHFLSCIGVRPIDRRPNGMKWSGRACVCMIGSEGVDVEIM